MGNIVLLDDLTINKIAAGEVIERPANVVKELVENSIDAGSTNIIVEVKNGGKTLVKVTDNGKGIATSDMAISLERHATSKIRKIEDLEQSYTMGFRGEALASISAVSELTMISKTDDEPVANKLFARAGQIESWEEVAAQKGTTIIVEKLFFNTPVRYKFLKNDATEFRYIKEFMQKVALAHPEIAVKLINDGKQIFRSSGSSKIEDVVYLVFGKDIEQNLVNVDYTMGYIHITGVVGNTFTASDNRKNQIIFLNERNIQDKVLTNSADQAFKGSIGIGKYGFFILNIQMPAEYYDVNVHPTKLQVRFKEEDQIYKVLYHAIKDAILSKDFLGNTEKTKNDETYIQNELNFVTDHTQFGAEYKKDSKANNFTSDGDLQNFCGNESEKATNESGKATKETELNSQEQQKDNYEIRELEDFKDEGKSLIERDEKRKIDYKYIGIIFRTYIVVEIGKDLFLIDQHAAHERVLYERIKQNYKQNLQNNVQMMLMPEIVDLSHKEMEFVKENIELFKNTGFDIEFFGENSVKINGVPNIEYKVNKNRVFLDTLDEMITNERGQTKDVEERFIATVACKAAVKAHMDLSRAEVDNLINDLLSLKNPYTCPHGRPTAIKI